MFCQKCKFNVIKNKTLCKVGDTHILTSTINKEGVKIGFNNLTKVIVRKIIFVVVAFLIFGLDDVYVKAKDIILEECEFTDEYKDYLRLSEDEKEKIMFIPTMCKNNSSDQFTLVGGSVTESKYDLRDYGYVTSVKDQGSTEACWTFATNASIESNLLVNGLGTYDLSEAHMELATQNTYDYGRETFSRTINVGGNYLFSSAYLLNGWGPILESDLPFSRLTNFYNNTDSFTSSEIVDKTSVISVNSISFIHQDTGVCEDSTIEDIKEYIKENGAIAAKIYSDGYNSYLYYNGESYTNTLNTTIEANQSVNHAVTIIGWDDSISAENFGDESHPSRDGAFIVKNSYGESAQLSDTTSELRTGIYTSLKDTYNLTSESSITDTIIKKYVAYIYDVETDNVEIDGENVYVTIGDNGYHYISYDDVYICTALTGFFDTRTEISDYTYNYATLGVDYNYSIKNNEAYFITQYEKKSNEKEKIDNVNIYIAEVGLQYEIYYADGKTVELSDFHKIASGTSDFIGYKAIDIDNIVITGDYSILVKMVSSNESTFDFGVSAASSLDSEANGWKNVNVTEGVQFMSIDGVNYIDTASSSFNILTKVKTSKTTEESSTNNGETPTPSTTDTDNSTTIIINENPNNEGLSNLNGYVDQTTTNPKTGKIYMIVGSLLLGISLGYSIYYINKKSKLKRI